MMNDIPAPGYKLVSGKRKPPASMGTHLFVQLRTMGWCPPDPFPVATANWVHTGSGADIVAIRRVDE
jgi:hypothetical protein